MVSPLWGGQESRGTVTSSSAARCVLLFKPKVASHPQRIMEELKVLPFDGFALGGMVPRSRNPELIIEIVYAIRQIESQRPVHVFGIGNPKLLSLLKSAGVDSTDSSSLLRNTANKKYMETGSLDWMPIEKADMSCECPVCRTHSKNFLRQPGEVNNLSLALHNLYANTLI